MVNGQDRKWGTSDEIGGMPTVMTLEREGWFTKLGLGCCALADCCKDGMYLHAGPPTNEAIGAAGILPSTIAFANQPSLGGVCTPTINLYNRTSAGADEASAFSPLAKVEGPCIFGGCSELCCDSTFVISGMTAASIESSIKTGDLATIVKDRPKGPIACLTEAFTDSDHFTVTFKEGVGLTPQQKAAFMASTILADYMFFEQDPGMVTCDHGGKRIKINLFECYIFGCVCPCVLTCEQKSGGGDGAPASEMELPAR